MESTPNFWLIWVVYLTAGAAFYAALWKMTHFSERKWTSYLLRSVFAAIILTPWYANPQDTLLAPALIVVLLDAITLGGGEAARALVPLFLALLLAILLASAAILLRKRRIKTVKKQKDAEET